MYIPPSPAFSVRAMLLLSLADLRRGGDWLTVSSGLDVGAAGVQGIFVTGMTDRIWFNLRSRLTSSRVWMSEVVEDANVMQGRCGVSTFHSNCTASVHAKLC
jgi:hypothetical protein